MKGLSGKFFTAQMQNNVNSLMKMILCICLENSPWLKN